VQAAANGTTLPVSVSASSVLGSTSGVAPATGVIGQLLEDTETTGVSASGTSSATVCNRDITAGVWAIYGQVELLTNNPTTQNANPRIFLQVNGDSETVAVNSVRLTHPGNAERNAGFLMRHVVASGTQTINLIVIPNLASGSYTAKGKLTAIRIG